MPNFSLLGKNSLDPPLVMQSVSTLWDFLSRSGPEDDLRAVALGKNSGSPTSGQDYGITRANPTPSSDLYYKDVEEAQRLVSIVESDGCVCGCVFCTVASCVPCGPPGGVFSFDFI